MQRNERKNVLRKVLSLPESFITCLTLKYAAGGGEWWKEVWLLIRSEWRLFFFLKLSYLLSFDFPRFLVDELLMAAWWEARLRNSTSKWIIQEDSRLLLDETWINVSRVGGGGEKAKFVENKPAMREKVFLDSSRSSLKKYCGKFIRMTSSVISHQRTRKLPNNTN